jgi:hypothetical protein
MMVSSIILLVMQSYCQMSDENVSIAQCLNKLWVCNLRDTHVQTVA